jgi:hypothetical protein
MSHTSTPSITHTADEAAAQAVVAHHAELATGLNQRVELLVQLVDTDHRLKAETARQDLVGYVRRDIMPHALAEEQALYPPAAALSEGRLLVAGMVDEHHVLRSLVDELAGAGTLVRAAAAARALSALFAAHLHKENDLVLPLLLAAPDAALSQILAGMHELLGAEHTGDHTVADRAVADRAVADRAVADRAVADPDDGGCGCGGCGCDSR